MKGCYQRGLCDTGYCKDCQIIPEAAMDKPQMTEEQFLQIMTYLGYCNGLVDDVRKLKAAGYITRPVWEEAEEMYDEWFKNVKNHNVDQFHIMQKMYSAIIALKEKAGIK